MMYKLIKSRKQVGLSTYNVQGGAKGLSHFNLLLLLLKGEYLNGMKGKEKFIERFSIIAASTESEYIWENNGKLKHVQNRVTNCPSPTTSVHITVPNHS